MIFIDDSPKAVEKLENIMSINTRISLIIQL